MLLKDKKAAIFGVANNKSIAYGISKAFKDNGARLAFSYVGEAIQKRVEPISEELGGDFTFPCDVSLDEDVLKAAEIVKKEWGTIDVLVHSVAFAAREDLQGRFIDTSRDGFKLALDISAYSLVALSKAFEDVINPGGSIITLTYYGSTKIIPNYNVMGVAKAALDCSMRYLAGELGPKDIRINAISAGPIRTLAASAVSGMKDRLSELADKAPLRRNVTIEDVGGLATFLASDLSAGMTGDTIFVDAGYNIIGG